MVRSKMGIFLSQRKYVLDLLKDTYMIGCKPYDTPIRSNHKLREDEVINPIHTKRYQRLMGKLMSLTKPDNVYVIGVSLCTLPQLFI